MNGFTFHKSFQLKGPEDVFLGQCMVESGMKLSRNSIDDKGLELFHSFSPRGVQETNL